VVTNNGPSCAQKVQLVDHFPTAALMTPGTLVTSGGQCTIIGGGLQDFSCNLLTVLPGQNVTVRVKYTVPSSASTCSLCNVVTVSSLTFDPELCNNDAKDCNSLIEKAQLAITKDDGISSIGGTDLTVQTYTIRVTNMGPSTARDVVVTDRWPAGFTQFLETLSSTTGRCVGVGGDFTCSIGDLAVGNVTTITVRYNNMQPPMCGTVSNWAAAFSPTDDTCREVWDNNTVTCSQQQQQQPVPGRQLERDVAPLEPTEVKRVEPKTRRYEPRAPQGKLLSAKLILVELAQQKDQSFRVAVKNAMRNKVVLEGLTVQITDRKGRTTTADLSLADGVVVAKTTCDQVLGSQLHTDWESVCEFVLVDAGASVKVSARGTQPVRGGYHPVMGAAAV